MQTIGLIATVLHSPRMHFMRTTPKTFALKENKFYTMVDALKKRQTITSTALRLSTFRLVFFPDLFFHILGMDNGIIDLWDPST